MILRDGKTLQTSVYLFIYYMNIQNVSSSRLYNQLYNQLYNRLQSVNGPYEGQNRAI